jgi:cytochrome o ubiquinol oxidase subunit 2
MRTSPSSLPDAPGRPWRRAAAALGLALATSSCSSEVLNPFRSVGPVAADDAKILIDATIIMLAIIVPTILLAFWMAWRYRASNTKAEYLPNWAYSGRIEAVVWSIPILTIMFIGGVIWIGSYQLDPFRPLDSRTPPVEVQVVSLDWKWLFIYPQQGIATVNQLVVPAGTPVHFSITSASVFNTFFVPRMGSMIYAMPGMVSQLNLQADRPADLPRPVRPFQRRRLLRHAVPGAQRAAGRVRRLDERRAAPAGCSTYRPTAARPAEPRRAALAFRAVDPRLFHAIASQKIPPAPGPEPRIPRMPGGKSRRRGGNEACSAS